MDGFRTRQGERNKSMSHFMPCYNFALLRIDQAVFLFQSGDHALDGTGEIFQHDSVVFAACGKYRGFIDEIGEIGAGKTGC